MIVARYMALVAMSLALCVCTDVSDLGLETTAPLREENAVAKGMAYLSELENRERLGGAAVPAEEYLAAHNMVYGSRTAYGNVAVDEAPPEGGNAALAALLGESDKLKGQVGVDQGVEWGRRRRRRRRRSCGWWCRAKKKAKEVKNKVKAKAKEVKNKVKAKAKEIGKKVVAAAKKALAYAIKVQPPSH